ncbi:hypothetical protein ANCDUO_14412 [Ancylostoma duodenale]|uniref:Uncharacterized protein n=1 Tax=Ancylostoma duodenale TaxID=51022 RepID=A0A0C2GEG6_9BILA|nr:hypothetical protein ANCDUO_14412 [Ancylostoma duodenale]
MKICVKVIVFVHDKSILVYTFKNAAKYDEVRARHVAVTNQLREKRTKKRRAVRSEVSETAESAPPRSYSEQSSPQVSAPPSPRPQQTQQQRRPVIDDDMGIARPPSSHRHRHERQSPDRDRPNQMTPKQQLLLLDHIIICPALRCVKISMREQ